MNNRIREIREGLGESQTKFGKRYNMTRSEIANIEYSKVEPKDTFLRVLCNDFNINMKWLKEGTGSKNLTKLKQQDKKIAEIFADISIDENSKLRNIIEILPELDNEYLEIIEKLINGIIKK